MTGVQTCALPILSRCSMLSLSVSSSWLGFPFGLPVGLRTALLLLLLSVVSVSTPSVASVSAPSVSSVVFAVLLVVCCDRGGKPDWLGLLLPISDGPGDIYTGFSGQYGFAQSLTFASFIYAVSFL